MNDIVPCNDEVNIQHMNILRTTEKAIILKRESQIMTPEGVQKLSNIFDTLYNADNDEAIKGLGCPVAVDLNAQESVNCSYAFRGKDMLTMMIKCSCKKCSAHNMIYIIEDDYGSVRNYLEFQLQNICVSSTNGAIFVKHFINDDRIGELAHLKKAGAKDEWADRPVFYNKDGQTKAISVVDLALNGNAGVEDSTVQKYGRSMKRWHGLCFRPAEQTTQKYNLFKGFPVQGTQRSIKPFIEFLYTVVGKDEANIILDYFAHLYQKPQEKPSFALIFKGTKGVGKNTTEEMLGKNLLRQENYYRTSNKEHFFGKFNVHFQQNLLSVMQELVWDGDKSYDSILKDMITESQRAVERKYFDQEMMDNYSRIVMTTNEDWVVPAKGKDERRYCVITFPSEKPEIVNEEYFNNLHKWYEDGGKEALMYHMLNRDISNFSVNKAPFTAGLEQQLVYSLEGIDKFCFDALNNGYFGHHHKARNSGDINYAYIYLKDNLTKRTNLYECFCFNHPDKANMTIQREFHARVKELMGANFKKKADANYVKFPELNISAQHFYNATEIQIDNSDSWSHLQP